MSKTHPLIALMTLCALGLGAADAGAVTLKVKCESRADRSTASVDGKGLAAGSYSAIVTSGANTAQSPQDIAVAGEAQFDFSSNPKDIHKGATPIAVDFITGGKVTGTLLDANGAVLAEKTATCRVR